MVMGPDKSDYQWIGPLQMQKCDGIGGRAIAFWAKSTVTVSNLSQVAGRQSTCTLANSDFIDLSKLNLFD